MTEFVSDVKIIPHTDSEIFRVLSDLSKLNLVKDKIDEDKIKDFSFDSDSVMFRIEPVGNVKFVVLEREPNKLVKFKSEEMPFDVFLWIQLVSKAEHETKMRLTVRAELNPFIKGMVAKPMKQAIDKISETLALLPYDKI